MDPVDAVAVTAPANPPIVPAPRGVPKFIASADERFYAVVDCKTDQLRVQRSRYGTMEARKMGRTAKDMKHSFGAESYLSGKTPLQDLTWLHKFVKSCNDNEVSEGMALYLIPDFLGGDKELRYARALPDTASRPGRAEITTYPEALNWLLLFNADLAANQREMVLKA